MTLELIVQILIIVGIDIILGGDNAVVIALACRNLPVEKRNKAIFLGTGLAIVVRILLTIMAVYLLMIPYLQLIGGFFLMYIAYHLLVEDSHNEKNRIQGGTTLFQAVRTIVLADLVMGFDNVVAIAGAANGKIILVILGLCISIPIIVWGSKIILRFMERYPIIIYIGSGILALTAGRMITHEERIQPLLEMYKYSNYLIPFLTILFVLSAGYVKNSSSKQAK